MSLRLALVVGLSEDRPLPPGVTELGRIGAARLVGDAGSPHSTSGNVVLAGWAFPLEGFGACEMLTPDEAAAIVASGGAWAIHHLWGNYLCAWADHGGAVWLLRSPVTGPAVYRVAEGGMAQGSARACTFTDLALARALGFALDQPDAAALDAQIRFPLLRGRTTGLLGVTEILPGEIVRLDTGDVSRASWSPWDHVKRPPKTIEPEELHACVTGVVGAWSARFGRIQLELSGGLDSSIVAACLSGRSTDWRAVNLATPGVSGDERIYARAAAQAAGAPLEEILLSDAVGDPFAALEVLRPRPAGFGLLGPSDAALLAAARAFGAEAIFTGAGGDNIFGYIRNVTPVIDALRFGGPGAAFRVAGDLARMSGDSVWRALALTLRRLVAPPRIWPSDGSFLSRRYETRVPEHPWLEDRYRVSPGQFAYGRALLPIQPFLDGYDRALALPMIAPLLSQPLVEFGLSVAAWQWCEGGQDRSLARRAFAGELPGIVRARRTKGRVDSLFVPAYDANRAALRRFLRDGWLSGAGVLDVAALDAALARPADALDAVYIRLLRIADVERWVRSL